MNDLIVFNPLYKNKDIAECFALYTEVVDGKLENSSKFVSLLIKLAEKYNLYDNLFNSLLTYLLINNENSFTLALERKKTIAANLKEIDSHLQSLSLILNYSKFQKHYRTI